MKRYWDLRYGSDFVGSESDLREEILRLLRESVRMRLESEVPLGAFLSGGLDSSTVVALAAEALSTPLNTFSIGFGAAEFDESRYARLVAQKFGTNHHELRLDEPPASAISDLVWHYDQPFGDSSAIPSLQVAEITRPHVTVVLTGDGGDETFVATTDTGSPTSRAGFACRGRCCTACMPLRVRSHASLAAGSESFGRARMGSATLTWRPCSNLPSVCTWDGTALRPRSASTGRR